MAIFLMHADIIKRSCGQSIIATAARYSGTKLFDNRQQLNQWRKAWAQTANCFLALYGHNIKIDHRTLAQQGIDRIPVQKTQKLFLFFLFIFKQGVSTTQQKIHKFTNKPTININKKRN